MTRMPDFSSTRCIPDELLQCLYQRIAERMGWSFPEHRRKELLKGLPALSQTLGFADPLACVRHLTSVVWSSREIQLLASYFTVGETYFYRHINDFDTIRKVILPPLIRERQYTSRRLRFWSAGCCTGEEPYTLATYLDECIPNIQDWDITILATDINLHFLEKARAGVYTPWSLRETSPQMSHRYFDQEDEGRYTIIPRIRRMVTFAYLNLAEPCYPSSATMTEDIDLIFCRNVMIYFAPRQIDKVMHKLHGALKSGGSMIVSSSETALVPAIFTREVHASTVLFRQMHNVYSSEQTAPKTTSALPDSIDWSGILDENVSSEESLPLDGSAEAPLPEEQNPPQKEELYGNALRLYEDGHYDGAAALLQEYSTQYPEDALRAKVFLVKCYANRSDWDHARAWCRECIRGDRFNPSMYYLEAGVQQEAGCSDLAIAALKRALYLDIDYIPAYVMLGILMQRAGRRCKSHKYFTTALELLERYDAAAVIPDGENLTAGRMREWVRSIMF